ncbi:AraC family transcriptional regulator [Vibrio sp. CyArs1]|uniref:AraC family transcriptional regulator n=1 Tax=Vibrio sp. CyArs1 TaxID=2682577 RepID=UPI001F0563A4|nr:AraC family transcriptional regulator [Vibrio sp. CyArs1]
MNHAIDFQSISYDLLTITPRKKTLHNQLFRVESGKVLLKLGKNEYVFNAGDTFWLPLDCLMSLTILPTSHVSVVKFSVRLTDSFPKQAGQVNVSTLTSALLDRLLIESCVDITKDLLQVIRHDVTKLSPKLSQTQECLAVSQWKPNSETISGELALALLVREARKQRLSGIKLEAICNNLFAGNREQLQLLSQSLLGNTDLR